MLKNFICPNRAIVPIDQCIKKCPFGERCAPLSYLKMCADERVWNGIPSVTQLIRGTREAFLKIVYDYSENPQDQVFRIIGSKGHATLEKYGINAEHGLEYEGITGIPDEIEPDPEMPEQFILIDNKVAGSFKVAKAIGMTEIESDEYNKKGKKIKHFQIVPENIESREWDLQLNMYRVMVEHELKIKIGKIKCFMPVRDGDTYIARNRGIEKNFYYQTIGIISDEKIIEYFIKKRDALLYHLEHRTMPEPCSPDEAWQGNKCKGYCSVVDKCVECPYL